METVNVLDARNHLSRLVAVAEHGGEVVIARRGRPVAKLVPVGGARDRTAESVLEWMLAHRLPSRGRSAGALDARILAEREAWDESHE